MLLALFLACTGSDSPRPDVDQPVDQPDDSGGEGGEGGEGGGGGEEETGGSWTLAVFMNGDNDLEVYVTHDLNELEQVGSSEGVNIVVQADRAEGYDETDGDWTEARRYLIEGDDDIETVSTPVLEELGEVDMGDPATLSEFILWADEQYPADHLAVVLWDHGDGWALTGDAPADDASYAVSWDEDTDNDISVAEGELASALSGVVSRRGKIDIVAFDACNMASFEVAHSLREQAMYLVASEATVGDEGLQYGPIQELMRDSQPTPRALAQTMAQTAVETGGEWTYSATDLSQMDALATELDALSEAILADPDTLIPWFVHARADARAADGVWHDWYVDLGDFAAVAATSEDPTVAQIGASLQQSVGTTMAAVYGSGPMDWTTGLTIYASTSELDLDYLDLYREGAGATWSQATRWDDLLQTISDARGSTTTAR